MTRWAPCAGGALGYPRRVQVSTCTLTALTVTYEPLLLTTRTAPASYSQVVGAHPSKIVLVDPSHGVGKVVASARRMSAQPEKTWITDCAAAGTATEIALMKVRIARPPIRITLATALSRRA